MKIYLVGQEKAEALSIIRSKTGYSVKNPTILSQMFRRSSFAAETGMNSNEIFEFIGDQVLSYYVVKKVSEKCGSLGLMDDYTFRIRENRFTQIKQILLSNEALAKIIDEWGIVKYLRLGKSDIKNEVIKETKVKADLFESIIGGIAAECNWNTTILESVVSKALNLEEKISELIGSDVKVRSFDMDNAITTLKEIAESGGCTMPEYEFTEIKTSDVFLKWSCTCSIINDEIGFCKTVEATSKKEAKKASAYLVLCEHLKMQNKYGENGFYQVWSYKDGKLFPIISIGNKEE